MELKTVEKAVKSCLTNNLEARKSDFTLYVQTLKELGYEVGVLERFFEAHKYNLPSFESVSRARRLIQATFPDLKDNHVSKYRKDVKEPEYKEYSKSEVI